MLLPEAFQCGYFISPVFCSNGLIPPSEIALPIIFPLNDGFCSPGEIAFPTIFPKCQANHFLSLLAVCTLVLSFDLLHSKHSMNAVSSMLVNHSMLSIWVVQLSSIVPAKRTLSKATSVSVAWWLMDSRSMSSTKNRTLRSLK